MSKLTWSYWDVDRRGGDLTAGKEDLKLMLPLLPGGVLHQIDIVIVRLAHARFDDVMPTRGIEDNTLDSASSSVCAESRAGQGRDKDTYNTSSLGISSISISLAE
ncbi:unnamed protein product [Protopolystoma xenopodis]|uniref:Uncharacterized protein n=1 Tax=Protopolystoma xenopodis TaxID=117903 RepID=A0A3S4ZH92_9PLAT|nr:unnamed protein product [Protopolystoma xenopodis]